MAMLSESDQQQVRQMLAGMIAPVRLVFFTQTLGCDSCVTARRILDEVSALSDLVTVEEYNFILDKEKVAEYSVDRVPAIAVVGEQDHGIRFYGAPAGYEFMSLVDAVLLVSKGDSGLSEETRMRLLDVAAPLSVQVFVTPT
jgi:alkyl hydroperoxide reductase subunit AhpF